MIPYSVSPAFLCSSTLWDIRAEWAITCSRLPKQFNDHPPVFFPSSDANWYYLLWLWPNSVRETIAMHRTQIHSSKLAEIAAFKFKIFASQPHSFFFFPSFLICNTNPSPKFPRPSFKVEIIIVYLTPPLIIIYYICMCFFPSISLVRRQVYY